MSNKTELAKRPEGALTPAPQFVEKGRAGFDTVDVNDIMFERLGLMQDLSPDVKSKKYAVGDIVRRSTDEVLYTRGGKPVEFVIAFYFKEFVEFGDRNNPNEQMVLQKTTDKTYKLAEEARQWTKKKLGDGRIGRKVQDVHNFIILVGDRLGEPLLVSCMKSNSKSGAALLALSNGRGDVPIYSGKYALVSDDQTNKKNQTFAVLRFRNADWASESQYNAAKMYNEQLSKAMAAGKVNVDYTAEDATEAGGAPADVKDADLA